MNQYSNVTHKGPLNVCVPFVMKCRKFDRFGGFKIKENTFHMSTQSAFLKQQIVWI